MTILSGRKCELEGNSELEHWLDITNEELLWFLSEVQKEEWVKEYNEVCEDWDEEPVDIAKDLPEEMFDQWREWLPTVSCRVLCIEVMEKREQEYVHFEETAFGTTFHTVFEVYHE